VQSTEYIDFRQYWFAIRRRWLPATVVFGFVVALTALNTLSQKPVYEARGRLLIKSPNNVTSTMDQKIGELSSVGSVSDPLKTETEMIRSFSMAQKVVGTLGLKIQPEELTQRITVNNIKGTDILEVSYKSNIPKEAAVVVNQLMYLYLAENLLGNRTEVTAARTFIVEQLPKIKVNVHQAEVALRSFEERNNIVDLEAESESAVGVIANLENQVSEAQAKYEDATAQSQFLRNKLRMSSEDAIVASSLSQSPGVQRALEEFQKVENELAIARSRYQEEHPIIVELESKRAALETVLQGRSAQVLGTQEQHINENSQIEQIKQQITANLVQLEAGRSGSASQVAALSNTLARYKQRIKILPALKQRKHELERELEAAQSTYETLLKRLEDIRVEENRKVGNLRIVEKAQIPKLPIDSNKTRNLALANLLGILLGIATALTLEALDKSIKTVEEAREVFGYTLLGLIPFLGKFEKPTFYNADSEQAAPEIVVLATPRSPISEAYRMLQANLKFVRSDEEVKTIVVTSSVPQEGKSTVAANLAVVVAQSGRRVLLVDADMRRPVQHKIWELLNQAGLSNVIVGQIDLRTVVEKVMDNLYVLSAGVIPPNPIDLLDSKRMASLIKNFSNTYDFIIIDTPSLNVAADAAMVGKMADGVLLVVRPGLVDSASAASAKEFLEQSGQHVLGQVVNGISPENKPYSYYYTKKTTQKLIRTVEKGRV
jgi:capsular exopolysaccharide synthesis family protein